MPMVRKSAEQLAREKRRERWTSGDRIASRITEGTRPTDLVGDQMGRTEIGPTVANPRLRRESR
jgi:hypothetical protein